MTQQRTGLTDYAPSQFLDVENTDSEFNSPTINYLKNQNIRLNLSQSNKATS